MHGACKLSCWMNASDNILIKLRDDARTKTGMFLDSEVTSHIQHQKIDWKEHLIKQLHHPHIHTTLCMGKATKCVPKYNTMTLNNRRAITILSDYERI